jgi:hypothetical protein
LLRNYIHCRICLTSKIYTSQVSLELPPPCVWCQTRGDHSILPQLLKLPIAVMRDVWRCALSISRPSNDC